MSPFPAPNAARLSASVFHRSGPVGDGLRIECARSPITWGCRELKQPPVTGRWCLGADFEEGSGNEA